MTDTTKIDEFKMQLDYLRKHYYLVVRTRKDEDWAKVSLVRDNITKQMKANGDKRADIVKVLDFLNDDPECLYYACL